MKNFERYRKSGNEHDFESFDNSIETLDRNMEFEKSYFVSNSFD